MGLLITGSHDSFTSQINLETIQTPLCCSQMNNSSAVAFIIFSLAKRSKNTIFCLKYNPTLASYLLNCLHKITFALMGGDLAFKASLYC